MTQPEKTNARRRTLFLSYLYPSFFGTGTQIRAAGLVRALAQREDVYLLVVYAPEYKPGARDEEMEGMCRQVELFSFNLDQSAPPDRASSESARVSGFIRRFYAENRLDTLFVYRIESTFCLRGHLESFPRRFLDLDELPSRRLGMIDRLKSISDATTDMATDRRLQMASRMLERKMIGQFETIFASSALEIEEVRRLGANQKVHLLPNIAPKRPFLTSPPAANPREILFVGTMGHFPNVDAVLYFYREILPLLLRKRAASVVFCVVGKPISDLLADMGRDPQVKFMGYQKDLDALYAAASVAVVPLRAGAGTRIKILEAFGYGRPVVSTTIGAEGLAVTHGENILLADTPEDFADACLRLFDSPELAARLVRGGELLRRERHSGEALLRLYDEAMAGSPCQPAG